MATMKNRKKSPLSFEELLEKCPEGIYVIEPESNPILVADSRNPQERWWVNDPEKKIALKMLSSGFFHTLVRLS